MKLLPTLIAFACTAGVALSSTASDIQDHPGVINGDFERGDQLLDSGWTWWAVHGPRAGSATFSDHAREGTRSVKVDHDGEMLRTRDWLLINRGRLDVKPGEEWTVSAWVKHEDTDMIGIEFMGLAGGKEITALHPMHKYMQPPQQGLWETGYAVSYGTSDWKLLEASAIIPPEIDQVYVRIGGLGKTKAWVDDVRVRRGLAQRTTKPKPKVKGWAFDGERAVDRLGRSLVAQPLPGGRVYVGWRLLARDPADVAFDLYRSAGGGEPVKLNDAPLTATTDFMDATADLSVENVYTMRIAGERQAAGPSGQFTLAAKPPILPYRSIPLASSDTTFAKVAVGDLDGDGRYDFVIKTPTGSLDPVTWRPSTYTYKLEAYLADGTFLWRKDLGWNIEAGTWYSPYVVYDLDGDGRAEVAVKTAPMDKDYRSTKPAQFVGGRFWRGPGFVDTGPEYVSILDGMTGEERARADWPSREGLGRYNHQARHQMGIGYLDGKTPCLLVARGTYTVMKLETYQFRNGKLDQQWYWDSTHEPGGLYFGQGSHTMHAADIDEDGRDEIILGGCVIDDNGDGLWTQGIYHADNLYVSDIDPSRPGLEIYYGIEGTEAKGSLHNGMRLVDARTGKMLWGYDQPTHHIHSQGLVSNIDPRHPGMECYSGERFLPKRWLHTAKGKLIADETTWSVGLSPRTLYWDASPEREVVVRGAIVAFPDRVITGGLEGKLVTSLDLFGDWREEIVASLPGELRIYSTAIPAEDRRVSLMEDPIYRNTVAHQSMGYHQSPLPSYYIGRE